MNDVERLILSQIQGLLQNMEDNGLGKLGNDTGNDYLTYIFNDLSYTITVKER